MGIVRDQLSSLGTDASTTASVVLTWSANPAAGAKVLVAVNWAPVSAAISSVQDNGTSVSTFTLDKTATNSTNVAKIAIYRADGISLPASGAYKVTITFGADVFVAAGGVSYTGAKAGAPSGSNTGTGTSSSVSTGTATPAAAGALFFAGFTTDSNANPETITLTASGFTSEFAETNAAAFMGAGVADKIDSGGPAATAGTWTLSDTPAWCAAVVAYDVAGTSAPAGLASGAGIAQAPAMAQAQLATGTGIAQAPAMAQAQLATGTGKAPASGMAQAGLAHSSGTISVTGSSFTGLLALASLHALQDTAAEGISAALPGGTGAAQQAAVQIGFTGNAPAQLAAGTGTALASGMARASAATAAGTVAPSVMVRPAIATGTGAAPPSVMVRPAIATGTGNVPSLAMGQAVLAAGTGAVPPSVMVPAALASGSGAAQQATVILGGAVISPGLEGYGFGTFPDVPSGSVVTSVMAAITQHASDALIDVPSYELWDGTSARIGAPQTGKSSTKPGNVDVVTFTGVSYSQLATLRLRIYATSASGNSGATVSVDAVSLSVVWVSPGNAPVAPATLAVPAAFPAPALAAGQTASPATTAAATAFPAVSAGLLPAAALPAALAVPVAFPAVALGTGVSFTVATLALAAAFPAPAEATDVSAPEWASLEDVQAGGSGSWTNAGNLTGTPDGSVAIWTVP